MTYKWHEMTPFERNKLVAEKCDGKVNARECMMFDGYACDGFNNFGDLVSFPLMNYSSSFIHALRLLDDFWEYRFYKSHTRGFICYGMTHDRKEYHAEGSTEAEAICKCALLCVGVDIE